MSFKQSSPEPSPKLWGWRDRALAQLTAWVAIGATAVNDVSAQRKVRQTNMAALLTFALLVSFAGVYAVTGATAFLLSAGVHLFWAALTPGVIVLNQRQHPIAAKHFFMALLHGSMICILAIQGMALSVDNFFLLFCVIGPMLFESRHWRYIVAWCCVSLGCYATATNMALEPLPVFTATVSPSLAALFNTLVMIALMVALIGLVIFSEAASARSERKLQALAETDALTGLANRRAFEVRLEQAMMAEHSCALLLMDIDYFKRVNDTWGHEAGDRVLQKVAQELRDLSRTDDFIARVGGEEFILLQTHATPEQALTLAARVCQTVSANVRAPCERQPITLSIGIAMASVSRTGDTLMRHADEALYAAKNAGRNQVRHYDAQRTAGPLAGAEGRLLHPSHALD